MNLKQIINKSKRIVISELESEAQQNATDFYSAAHIKSTLSMQAQIPEYDLICFSHLRWNFVYQRPQHLLSRCAKARRVFFFEEPMPTDGAAHLRITNDKGIHVVIPQLPDSLAGEAREAAQQKLLNDLITDHGIEAFGCWYYTPMALGFSRHLKPVFTVYDCMDELSAFKGAPPLLRQREQELFKLADLVFTGGQSLYEVKKQQHHNVTAFPSSVDIAHFSQARKITKDPEDQALIPHPRLGFFGVIDERFDIDLIAGLADMRPDWHLVMIGPVVKIDHADLPQRPNIHYLGSKSYDELPKYIAGWDVALLTFARNESTRFISPTKTPEYMAAGKPVVSTSIQDVVHPYGDLGLVRIADTPAEFVRAVEAAMKEDRVAAQKVADKFLASMSWDKTWHEMECLLNNVTVSRSRAGRSVSVPSVRTANLMERLEVASGD